MPPTADHTLVLAHQQCTTHVTHKSHPEQPARVKVVMAALRERLLQECTTPQEVGMFSSTGDITSDGHGNVLVADVCNDEDLLHTLHKSEATSRKHLYRVMEIETSPAMLAMLEAQLVRGSSLTSMTSRTESVDYFRLRVLPAVQCVHTRAYLEKLRSTCEELASEPIKRARGHARRPVMLQRNLSGIAGDTYASRNSLSAALCGVITACKAVDAVVAGGVTNAFCAIRPPGHHAGTDGSTFKDMVAPPHKAAEKEAAAPPPAFPAPRPPAPTPPPPLPTAVPASVAASGFSFDPAVLAAHAAGAAFQFPQLCRRPAPPRKAEGQAAAAAAWEPAPAFAAPSPVLPPRPADEKREGAEGEPRVESMASILERVCSTASNPETQATASDSARCDDRCSQGFCLLNNAAIAAKYALLEYPSTVRKVAIVDWDLHHGNGTEEIVRRDGWEQVMYCSLHGAEKHFYPETATELHLGPRIVNVPLKRGTPAREYHELFERHVLSRVLQFNPDLIIISCGFDAHKDDAPDLRGFLTLNVSDYQLLTAGVKRVAAQCCQGRVVSLLEGGYNLKAIAKCSTAHVLELCGHPGDPNPDQDTTHHKSSAHSQASATHCTEAKCKLPRGHAGPHSHVQTSKEPHAQGNSRSPNKESHKRRRAPKDSHGEESDSAH
ncbi:hypothetical protein AB1Y20_006324 [Prymnesium parvum]|uniref:histone deacetylase n=1 Tax=Prymnesium parvum TaxID=97485 RepID=A0AB34J1J9_PRYPA